MEAVFRSIWPIAIIFLLAFLAVGKPSSEDNELAHHALRELGRLSSN